MKLENLAIDLQSRAPAAGSIRASAQEHLIAVVTSWRRALATYASGLRDQDAREVLSAFDYMKDAEQHEAQAQVLLDDFERKQRP